MLLGQSANCKTMNAWLLGASARRARSEKTSEPSEEDTRNKSALTGLREGSHFVGAG